MEEPRPAARLQPEKVCGCTGQWDAGEPGGRGVRKGVEGGEGW